MDNGYIVVKKSNAHICSKICSSAKQFTSSWTFVHTQFLLRLLDILMAETEMVPDLIWAPGNIVPKKFGPQETWSLHEDH